MTKRFQDLHAQTNYTESLEQVTVIQAESVT